MTSSSVPKRWSGPCLTLKMPLAFPLRIPASDQISMSTRPCWARKVTTFRIERAPPLGFEEPPDRVVPGADLAIRAPPEAEDRGAGVVDDEEHLPSPIPGDAFGLVHRLHERPGRPKIAVPRDHEEIPTSPERTLVHLPIRDEKLLALGVVGEASGGRTRRRPRRRRALPDLLDSPCGRPCRLDRREP